jgi:hypothetical protein
MPTRIAVATGVLVAVGRDVRFSFEPVSLTLLELDLGDR